MATMQVQRAEEVRHAADVRGEATVSRDRGRTLQLTSDATVIRAPARLVSETRSAFRQAALDVVSRAALLRAATVTVDLSSTEEIDASGLGILVLAQRRARDHQITVALVGVRPSVRRLMELTRLDYLFHIVS